MPNFGTFSFFVEMDSVTIAEFSEVSGLQAEIETLEWKEGGNNHYSHTLPVRTRWPHLTLKRGVADQSFWDWFSACSNGSVSRRGLSIALYSWTTTGSASVMRWSVVGALPVKWSGPTLKAGANELAFETIELAHNGLTQTLGGRS